MKKNIIAIVIALAGFTAGLSGAAVAVLDDQPTAVWMQRPCSYEDSANCFWDAGERGDGNGHSFYTHVMDIKTDGTLYKRVLCVMYTEHNFAKTHDRCATEYGHSRVGVLDVDGDGQGGER